MRTRFLGMGLVLFVAAALAWLPSLHAQEGEMPAGIDDCLDCHELGVRGPDFEEGDPPPIDTAGLMASPHADFECTDCHADVDPEDLPHDEDLARVACGDCHDDIQEIYDRSLHGLAVAKNDPTAPHCPTCHGKHDILPSQDQNSRTNILRIPALCGQCHREGSEVSLTHDIPQDSIFFNYSQSIHGEGLYQKGLTVTAVCSSCHTAHSVLPHTDPRSTISKERIAETCTKCHGRIEEVHTQVIRGELWEKQPHVIPACVDCHSPHQIRNVYYNTGMADRDCLECHSRQDLVSETGIPSERLYVDEAQLDGSRHERVACVQCHTEGSPIYDRPCKPMTGKVDCSICHSGPVERYNRSTHGQLAAELSPDAPICADCHGTHGILGPNDPQSPIFSRNVPELCGKCHRAGEKAAARRHDEILPVEHYEESIHGKGLLESGLTVTATCADCHGAHDELPASDPASTVNAANVAKTCAQCHQGIYDAFSQSIHSPLVSDTEEELPTCQTCHSAHDIARVDVTNFQLDIMDQCGHCHEEIAESYFQTYHGKVSELGYTKTAKCYDCHGAHNIQPTWNPASTLHRDNIVETCRQCHQGSNRRFAGYLTHATHHDPAKYPFLFYAFWGMTGLLVGTLTFFGLHTLLWLPRSIRYRREIKAMEAAHGGEPQVWVRRFKKYNVRLHRMVIISFLALAISGMTLKFAYTGWARVLSRVMGGFEGAGLIHRIAAGITFLYFTLHILDLARKKLPEAGSVKELIFGNNSMLPQGRDLREFVGSLKWFLGMGPRPEYGRWTYWEKFDYLAVFWGVAVIGLTGLMLWFSEFFTRFIPGSVLNIATIIHSDEALLAVGFIFTIHFFNTHFRPEKFPMDPVIFSGRVPLEEFKIDRPREYRELVESGKLEEHLVGPPEKESLRAWKIFGFSALTVGILVIFLIIYGSVVAYQ